MNKPLRIFTFLMILMVALAMPVSSISIHPEPAPDYTPPELLENPEPLSDQPGFLYTTTLRFKVLFIKAEFTTTTHVKSENLDGKRSTTVSKLVRSHNDRISESRESRYLEAVEMNGRDYTYARYKSHIAYSNPYLHSPGHLQCSAKRICKKSWMPFVKKQNGECKSNRSEKNLCMAGRLEYE